MYDFVSSSTDGLSLLNEDGGLRVFFPRRSFVTNTTLTHTNTPPVVSPGASAGNDHIVCYGGSTPSLQVTWHNSGGQLAVCIGPNGPALCYDCGGRCLSNGAVGVDAQDNEHTDIHMYTDSTAYVNQDLECRVSSGKSAFIGVYLKDGSECGTLTEVVNSTTQYSTYTYICLTVTLQNVELVLKRSVTRS